MIADAVMCIAIGMAVFAVALILSIGFFIAWFLSTPALLLEQHSRKARAR